MTLLLISKNRVVKEMFRIATTNDDFELYLAERLEDIDIDRFNFLFIDEDILNQTDINQIRDNFMIEHTVLISSARSTPPSYIKNILKKPFLPSDILSIIQNRDDSKESEEKTITLKSFLEEKVESNVLNIEDIKQIRELLDDDTIEPEAEAFLSNWQPGSEDKECIKVDLKAKEILKLLKDIKPKQLKKLLKGSKITITIDFKENR